MARPIATKVVLVKWGDAWQGEENDHRPHDTSSVGYLVKRDKAGIMIAGCTDESGDFDRYLFVPAGMIQSVKILRD